MATLADLLRYKKPIDIRHPETGKVVKTVWIRVLGDLDLTTAYKKARIASSQKRLALRNPESDDYKDEVLGAAELSRQEQIEMIQTSNLSKFVAEAQAFVERPELPKLEEVAVEPDAANLEELEKLDQEEIQVEKQYRDKLDEYIALRQQELIGQLQASSDEEILKMCQYEISNLIPFTMFMGELNDWKAFLGTFSDEACKIKEFATIEDFKQLPKPIKEFIIIEINNLEIDGAEIKN